jgi:nitroreductase/NAD-dependent dihydropyrimidine dehydrogenase PreA subunit
MNFTINTDECTFCGLCANECPSRAITIEKDTNTAGINHSGCIQCSHCGMVCPVNAIRVDGERLADYPANTDTLEHHILSKRSVRHYKDEPIKQRDMKAVLLAGRLTATASNSQQVKAIYLESDEVSNLSKLIAGVLLKVVNIGLNPVAGQLLKLFGLGRYTKKDALKAYQNMITETLTGRADIFFFHAPAVVILTYPAKGKRFGRTDCALAGQNMMLTAQGRGIGSCMIGFAEAALMTKKLRRQIGVESNRRIGLIFTLGYSNRKYYRYPKRAEFVNQERRFQA